MSINRDERLAADYREMLKIQDRPYLSWTAIKGELPRAEEYLLTVRLRTYALSVSGGKYIVGAIDSCTVKISLWYSYPKMAPNIKMLSLPPVFHPSWYSKGTYCPAEPWREDDSLKDYVMRMLRTLCYVPDQIDAVSPANYKALDWYLKNRDDKNLFPSDTTPLTENEEISPENPDPAPFVEIVDSRGI